MTILNIHWNYVQCLKSVNLKTFRREPAVTYDYNVEPNCRGVYFRAVLTEEVDFSETLKGLRWDDPQPNGQNNGVRRSRSDEGSQPFSPKSPQEKSIGVLRIMKPRKLNSVSGINVTLDKTNMVSRSKDYDVLLETTEFILEDAQEQMQERFQLQETFGDFNVFFFGKRAEIFTYSGSLLNGCKDLQWRNQFLYNYENYLRGTRCVELKARAYFLYDDIIREGFILSAATQQGSAVDGVVKFNFTMLITDKRTMGHTPEGRRGLSLTLDRQGDTKQGTPEFRFHRSLDPNLPQVTDTFAVSDDGFAIPANHDHIFVQDLSLPGDQPPEDLRVQMQNLSIKALNETGAGDITSASDESLDHDILLDFIHSSKLGENTRLIASGVKSLDADNLTGDQLVLTLTSNPPGKTLGSLQLKQAVSVALSFATVNAALCGGGDVAAKLGELAGFFAANSENRALDTHSESADYDAIFSTKNKDAYILQKARDLDNIDALIAEVQPILTLKKDTLTQAAIESVKTSSVLPFLATSDGEAVTFFKAAVAYAAAVALLRNPANLNPFPAFAQLVGDVNSFSNTIDYILSQPVSKLEKAIKELPDQVQSSLAAATSNFLGSVLMGKVAFRFPGRSLGSLPVSEWTLFEATQGPTPRASEESAKFMMQISVLVTGIVAEIGASINATFDVTSGTVLPVKDDDAAKTSYFTKAYADSLKPGSSKIDAHIHVDLRELGVVQTAFGNEFGDARFIALPVGRLAAGTVLMRPYGALKTPPGDSFDVVSAGYVRVPANLFDAYSQSGPLSILAEGWIRKPGLPAVPGAPDIPVAKTGFQIQFGAGVKVATPKAVSSATSPLEYPASRKYIGHPSTGSDKEKAKALKVYVEPTVDNVVGAAKSSGAMAIAGISSAILDMGNITKKFIAGEIAKDVDETVVKSALALSNLTASTDISVLNEKVAYLGATVTNFVDLLFVAEREQPMAKRLVELKDYLAKAIAAAQGDAATGGKAAIVKDSDAATKGSICHV